MNAKLGDQLGQNFWTTKSKYGATIQNALDYTMSLDPKEEDVSDIFPHVAAVAAAYGDPSGKYKSFLQSKDSNYKSEPFWFYDQTSAVPNSPMALAHHKRGDEDESGPMLFDSTEAIVRESTSAAGSAAEISFECPSVFDTTFEVQLEDGLYVTCDQLKPFYEIASNLPLNATATNIPLSTGGA